MISFSHPIYSRRKRFLPEYRDFFAALLKIPDIDVRERVTDAVNGIQTCSLCKMRSEYKIKMSVALGTQTEPENPNKMLSMVDVTTQTESENVNGYLSNTETVEDINSKQPTPGKRRRKRKRNCPKVVKTAQHSTTTPVLKQNNPLSNSKQVCPTPAKLTRPSSDDKALACYFDECNSNDISPIESPASSEKTVEAVQKYMENEWKICDKLTAGLLPIHEAIIKNELHKLQTQIYVWNKRSFDLSKLVTDENDNPIQLAIKENCFKRIIDELLKHNIDLTSIDDDHNTIIHLAVSHIEYDSTKEQQQLIGSLLNKIDLNMLSIYNDDGLTALHIAVKRNQYLTVENILNEIDTKLCLESVPRPSAPYADQKTFLQHYCGQCNSFEGRQPNEDKNKILNAKDMKSGCTALFFAMELGHEHIVYLLLAHMCDPNIKNLSGLDAKSYYTEYGTNPSIAGAIEKLTMVI